MVDLVLGFEEGFPDPSNTYTPGKWKTIHENVEKLPVVNREDNKGWKGFILADKKQAMLLVLWKKYGVIGLGFFGTFSVGAPISIAVGTGLNADLKKLATWCCVGVLTRCIVFTLIGYYGLQLL